MTVTRCRAVYSLVLLTLCYVTGELGHFLIGITSREVAQEIHFGDKACLPKELNSDKSTANDCLHYKNESSCEQLPKCSWNYTGLGLDYQLLAGPAFVAVFSISSVLWGIAADFLPRSKLIGLACLLFSGSTLCMGFATEYHQLLLLRMILAAGESGCTPLGVSIISDLFSDSYRGTATGIFHWGIYFGYGLSYLIGVYMTAAFGWRSAFQVAGMPGLVIGLLLLLNAFEQYMKVDDEVHSEEEQVRLKDEDNRCEEKQLAFLPSLWNGLMQPAIFFLFVGASFRHCAGFTFAYNTRLYFLTYHPSVDVGLWLSSVSIFGGCLGAFLGGLVSDRIGRVVGVSARVWILGTAMVISGPLAAGVLYFDPPYAFLALLGYYVIAETWFGIIFVVLVTVVPSNVKTTVIGVFLFLMNNVGGNAPVLIDPLAKAIGYREALMIFCPGFMVISGLFFLISSLPLRKFRHSTDGATKVKNYKQAHVVRFNVTVKLFYFNSE